MGESEQATAALQPSRRKFLRQVGAMAAAPFFPAVLRLPTATARPRTAGTPIRHVIVACQENHSFDTYFGYYPNAGSYGVPSGYTQPDGNGGTVAPHRFTSGILKDISHEWAEIHSEWDSGRMDGFYTTDGSEAVGYFDSSTLSFYYSVADHFTLCGNYFCSLLGPTYPNRLYLCSGTSGGNTSNNIAPGTLNYPILLDVLQSHGITFKGYDLGLGAAQAGLNAPLLFAKWVNDPRLTRPESELYRDLRNGTLPQVSFLAPGVLNCEHPPAPVPWGEQKMSQVLGALFHSPVWASTAFFLTYDEGGGFFDHVAPPQFDAYGAGIRVPTLVVSPFAKRGHVEGTQYEHSSILKFIEFVFGLPTLASINHQFDVQTPGTNNDAAGGQPYGPPQPPRDGRSDIGDMAACFDFTQSARYRPRLAPAPPGPSRQTR
jgi:phospholipase C